MKLAEHYEVVGNNPFAATPKAWFGVAGELRIWLPYPIDEIVDTLHTCGATFNWWMMQWEVTGTEGNLLELQEQIRLMACPPLPEVP